jgi:hypothetical protein
VPQEIVVEVEVALSGRCPRVARSVQPPAPECRFLGHGENRQPRPEHGRPAASPVPGEALSLRQAQADGAPRHTPGWELPGSRGGQRAASGEQRRRGRVRADSTSAVRFLVWQKQLETVQKSSDCLGLTSCGPFFPPRTFSRNCRISSSVRSSMNRNAEAMT